MDPNSSTVESLYKTFGSFDKPQGLVNSQDTSERAQIEDALGHFTNKTVPDSVLIKLQNSIPAFFTLDAFLHFFPAMASLVLREPEKSGLYSDSLPLYFNLDETEYGMEKLQEYRQKILDSLNKEQKIAVIECFREIAKSHELYFGAADSAEPWLKAISSISKRLDP